jgi:hypothetical protein
MRNSFTALLFVLPFSFACSKHQSLSGSSSTPVTPVDSFNLNVYLDPGQVNLILRTDTFHSFNLIHASDTLGMISIMAKGVVDADTATFTLTFPDSLQLGVPYTGHEIQFAGITSVSNIFLISYTTSLGAVYRNNTQPPTADTLQLTSFDKTNHTLAGSFAGTMVAVSKSGSGTTTYTANASGAFSTYFNVSTN